MAKNLIIYYSRKGENYWNGSIKSIAKGNTERVAEFVQKAVGGDLFEVDTVKPYSASYMTCIDEAKKELREDARPEIKAYPDNIADYDTIFVGYERQVLTCKPVTVKQGAWIGAGATILPGVTVGKYAVVGAASVVTHDVPDYAVVVGNPAKVIKTLDAAKFE